MRAALWLVAVVAVSAMVAGGVYAATMQPRLAALPSLVHTRLRTQGGGPYVPYAELPPFLVDALVATEDRSFWTNPGISFEGVARAAVVDISHGAFLQGASTLQQQLVRDMFLTPRKTLVRKAEGTLLALVATAEYPRTELLALYLNEVYLGQGAYGVASAARIYFGETVAQLTPAQCALLAGLPQAPSAYDPISHYAAAKARQNEVLASMVAAGYIEAARARSLYASPLHLVHG